MRSFVAGKDFLTAVLNELCMDGRRDRFTVREDFLGERLFDVRCSDLRLDNIASRESMGEARSQLLLSLDPAHHQEVPSHDDLRHCLHSSLLLPPENLGLAVKAVNDAVDASRRRQGFLGQQAVSIDSNLAYKRLLSRLYLERSRFGIEHENPKDLLVTISKVSIRELAKASNHKLDRHRDPGGLKRALRGRPFADALPNRPTLRAAKALNALAEQGAVRDIFTYYEVDGGMGEAGNSADADEMIVRELSAHNRSGQLEQVFLTADDSMSALLDAERMRHVVLRYPKEVPSRLESTPWLLRELLYDLSLVFRSIRIEGSGVSLMGIWPDKSSSDYADERICIATEDGSRIGEELQRDHRILRRFHESELIDMAKLR